MMAETIVFPDIAAAVTAWLTAKLPALGATVHVGTTVPNPRPTRFITVRRVGGAMRNLVVDAATLTIEAWGDDEADAHDLAQLARGSLHAAEGQTTTIGTFYRVEEFAGPVFLPDPDSDQPRYTFTVTVAARGYAAP